MHNSHELQENESTEQETLRKQTLIKDLIVIEPNAEAEKRHAVHCHRHEI